MFYMNASNLPIDSDKNRAAVNALHRAMKKAGLVKSTSHTTGIRGWREHSKGYEIRADFKVLDLTRFANYKRGMPCVELLGKANTYRFFGTAKELEIALPIISEMCTVLESSDRGIVFQVNY